MGSYRATPPPYFKLELGVNRACQWEEWSIQFDIFKKADSSVSKTDHETQVAIFLNCGGPLVMDIYKQVKAKIEPTGTKVVTVVVQDRQALQEVPTISLQDVLNAFDDYFDVFRNVTEFRHKFLTSKQAGRDLDVFIRELEVRSKQCGFCERCRSSLVKDMIIVEIDYERIRQGLLSKKDLDLEKAESMARRMAESKVLGAEFGCGPSRASQQREDNHMEIDAMVRETGSGRKNFRPRSYSWTGPSRRRLL